MSDELMTLEEAAKYLKLTDQTILNLIHKNEIPAIKVGNQWKFIKPVIDDWILSKMNYKKIFYNDIQSLTDNDIAQMKLTSFFDKDFILHDIKSGNKEKILKQLIKPLSERKIIESEDSYLSMLLERENIVSTGIGHGIAIPHLKNIKENPDYAPFLVFGICKEGTDFNSPDHKPAYLFFLLCTKIEAIHLKILAKISSIFINRDIINSIIKTTSIKELLEVFTKSAINQ
ncbi:MAG: PTS sugar transporter subunit IIA [Spirochaetes bacterium]|nr:PTS sugar transporter subunit IIA [Spirochaetota bacterium]